MMRILQLNTGDKLAGGAQKVAWYLHKRYQQEGYDSQFAVGYKCSNDPFVHQINTNRFLLWFERWFAPRVEKRLGLQYFMYPSSLLLAAKKYFRKADIIHIHNTHWGYFTHLALPFLSSQKPIVWTLHDMWPLTGHCAHSFECQRWEIGCGDCPNLMTYPPLKIDNTRFLWRVKNQLYHKTNIKIVTPSNWLKNYVEKSVLSHLDCVCIPNAVDLNIFNPSYRKDSRLKLEIPEGAKVIAFTLPEIWDEYKGYSFLVDGLKKIPDQSCILLQFGNRQLPEELLAKFTIIHAGWQEDDRQLAAFLSAADLFLQPSLADNAPLAVIEAMACGLPVIASEVGGIPEIIREPLCGLLVSPKDADGLSKAIQKIFNNEEMRLRMSLEARQVVEKDYGLDLQADHYISLYRRTIEERQH